MTPVQVAPSALPVGEEGFNLEPLMDRAAAASPESGGLSDDVTARGPLFTLRGFYSRFTKTLWDSHARCDKIITNTMSHSLGSWYQIEIVGEGDRLSSLVDGQAE